ncbi:MAG: hypothetical protein ACRDR6_02545 [Pseudonocardiaceae bacterium]
MSDALSFAEIEGQHVELLPARTVMTLFTAGEGGQKTCTGGSVSTQSLIPIDVAANILGFGNPSAGNITGGSGGPC